MACFDLGGVSNFSGQMVGSSKQRGPSSLMGDCPGKKTSKSRVLLGHHLFCVWRALFLSCVPLQPHPRGLPARSPSGTPTAGPLWLYVVEDQVSLFVSKERKTYKHQSVDQASQFTEEFPNSFRSVLTDHGHVMGAAWRLAPVLGTNFDKHWPRSPC